MIFSVKYSQKRDLNNYVDRFGKNSFQINYGIDLIKTGSAYFPIEFLLQIDKAPDAKSARQVVENYWQKTRDKNFNKRVDLVRKWIEIILNKETDLIIPPLEDKFRQKFPFKSIKVYLTSFFMCPYNYEERWFMLGMHRPISHFIQTSRHELNHFMFYYYFRHNLQKLGYPKKSIEYLKEAFAVLTSDNPKNENLSKTDIIPLQDFVYQNRRKSVDKIVDLVIKNKLLDNIK